MNRRAFLTSIAGAALGGVTPARAADNYPGGPVSLIVPFTPAGSTDILARLLGQRLSELLGQPVVIDNRPGAGGTIASDYVARARPDGRTLMMGHIGTLAINPNLYPKLPYDAVRSFDPVGMMAEVTNVLVVNPEVPARSVAELIEHARKNPKKLNYATGGIGSAAHIATAAFADAAGIALVHVPYRGTGPALTDLISGQVQLSLTGTTATLQFVRGGQLRALGVSTRERIAAAPEIPTISEAGLPGFEAAQWYGVVAPAGTPEAIVMRLNAEITRAMEAPSIIAALERDGAKPWIMSPQEFRQHIVREIARWGEVIRRANIRIE